MWAPLEVQAQSPVDIHLFYFEEASARKSNVDATAVFIRKDRLVKCAAHAATPEWLSDNVTATKSHLVSKDSEVDTEASRIASTLYVYAHGKNKRTSGSQASQ